MARTAKVGAIEIEATIAAVVVIIAVAVVITVAAVAVVIIAVEAEVAITEVAVAITVTLRQPRQNNKIRCFICRKGLRQPIVPKLLSGKPPLMCIG